MSGVTDGVGMQPRGIRSIRAQHRLTVRQPVLPRSSAIAAMADCDKHLRIRIEYRHTPTRHPLLQVRYQPHRDQTATKVLIHLTLVTPGDT
jgi:hypothetical protein